MKHEFSIRLPAITQLKNGQVQKRELKDRPEEIILHVGTNDFKNSDSRKVAEWIVHLGNFIEAESSNTKVTISNLLLRTDDTALNSKVNQVNKILKTFATNMIGK